MKEVALLLGEIAENAPVQVGNSRHGLLTDKQVMQLLCHENIVCCGTVSEKFPAELCGFVL